MADYMDNVESDWAPEAQLIKVGDFTISCCGDDGYWIVHSSGEGMLTPKVKFDRLIAEFFGREF